MRNYFTNVISGNASSRAFMLLNHFVCSSIGLALIHSDKDVHLGEGISYVLFVYLRNF